MTKKQQLINEIADLIVERLDESSYVDKYEDLLNGIDTKAPHRAMADWFNKKVMIPIINFMQRKLQTLTPEKLTLGLESTELIVGADIGRYSEPLKFYSRIGVSRGSSRGEKYDDVWLNFFVDHDGFTLQEKNLEVTVKEKLARIIIFVIREGVETWTREENIEPLTTEESQVVNAILTFIKTSLKQPDLKKAAKTIRDRFTRTD